MPLHPPKQLGTPIMRSSLAGKSQVAHCGHVVGSALVALGEGGPNHGNSISSTCSWHQGGTWIMSWATTHKGEAT